MDELTTLRVGTQVRAKRNIVCDGITVPIGTVGEIREDDRGDVLPFLVNFRSLTSVPCHEEDIELAADDRAAGFVPGDVFRAGGSGGIRVMVLVEREAPTFATWTAWFTRITRGGSACFKAGGIVESELSEHWELLTGANSISIEVTQE